MSAFETAKDPVCGMDIEVNPRKGWDYLFEGTWQHFCGSECRHKFQSNPAGYMRPNSAASRAAASGKTKPTAPPFLERIKSWFS